MFKLGESLWYTCLLRKIFKNRIADLLFAETNVDFQRKKQNRGKQNARASYPQENFRSLNIWVFEKKDSSSGYSELFSEVRKNFVDSENKKRDKERVRI